MSLPAIFAIAVAFAGTPTPLFSPNDLQGWVEEQHDFFKKKHPNAQTWSVKDGIVSCDGKLGNCGFLRYEKKLGDFTLRLEYRVGKNSNSGVCFRNRVPYDGRPDVTLPSRTGFEFQIFGDAGQPPSKTSTGALYNLVAPKVNASRPAGEWNELELDCRGPKIHATLNGQLVLDVDQDKEPAIADRPREGYISLQNHGHKAEFRNVTLTK